LGFHCFWYLFSFIRISVFNTKNVDKTKKYVKKDEKRIQVGLSSSKVKKVSNTKPKKEDTPKKPKLKSKEILKQKTKPKPKELKKKVIKERVVKKVVKKKDIKKP